MAVQKFRQGDSLLLVDVQNDFCPGGALEVPEGDKIVPALNQWIAKARSAGVAVLASRDWHPRQHVSFEQQGGPWPEHCVQDTEGAAFHPDLELPEDTVKVSKGVRFDKDQYSAFDDTGLGEFLRKQGVKRILVGGLAQDVCVKASVIDGCKEGFEIHLLKDCTRAIDADSGRKALEEMRDAGAVIEEGE